MDTKLRIVEKDVLIPRYLELKINTEYCNEQLKNFHDCAKEAGLLVTFKCKPIYNVFVECSNKWFNDEGLREEVTQEYLRKRDKFRKTGVAEKSPFSRLR